MVVATKVHDLIAFRLIFGAPNFFKLFRAFYALCHVPEECQNNPLVIHMNRNSCVKNFERVFGHDNEEVAIRFNELFVEPEGLPKMYNVDILVSDETYLLVANVVGGSAGLLAYLYLRAKVFGQQKVE